MGRMRWVLSVPVVRGPDLAHSVVSLDDDPLTFRLPVRDDPLRLVDRDWGRRGTRRPRDRDRIDLVSARWGEGPERIIGPTLVRAGSVVCR